MIISLLRMFWLHVSFLKRKDWNMQHKTRILPIFFWVWNLVFNSKSWTQIENIWEEGAEENIWT
jgi:hypothetical protein